MWCLSFSVWPTSFSVIIFRSIHVAAKVIISFFFFSSVQSLSHVQLFVTPWTAACQAPLSMGVPRQEYWSGFIRSSCFSSVQSLSHVRLFATPRTVAHQASLSMGLNLCLLHYRWILYHWASWEALLWRCCLYFYKLKLKRISMPTKSGLVRCPIYNPLS